jgi:hypothetical protein
MSTMSRWLLLPLRPGDAAGINLWDEHIPERTLVVLGGKDMLSPAAHVNRWLREHTHAQVRPHGYRNQALKGIVGMKSFREFGTAESLLALMDGASSAAYCWVCPFQSCLCLPSSL